jgi:xylan 1,4-beta-xylosidase
VAEIEVNLDGLPKKAKEMRVREYRIDGEHANPFMVWKKMGSPVDLTAEQRAELEKAGQLAELEGPRKLSMEKGEAKVQVRLPRQGVALLVIE